MSSIFVIYLTTNCETTFSQSYSSFNQAKSEIEPFLEKYRQKLGKELRYLSKSEIEELKTFDDVIYARKKTSQATLYRRATNAGRIYNTYSLVKFGKLEITEFSLETAEPEVEKKQVTVENMSHGAHGNLLAELREKISGSKLCLRSTGSSDKKRQNLINNSEFINALNSRKERLNHVDPPVRKLIL